MNLTYHHNTCEIYIYSILRKHTQIISFEYHRVPTYTYDDFFYTFNSARNTLENMYLNKINIILLIL